MILLYVDSLVPPVIDEILPSNGKSGSRVCLLGRNFVNSPKLMVRFGTISVPLQFHEQVL
jgi:hypothetical protein